MEDYFSKINQHPAIEAFKNPLKPKTPMHTLCVVFHCVPDAQHGVHPSNGASPLPQWPTHPLGLCSQHRYVQSLRIRIPREVSHIASDVCCPLTQHQMHTRTESCFIRMVTRFFLNFKSCSGSTKRFRLTASDKVWVRQGIFTRNLRWRTKSCPAKNPSGKTRFAGAKECIFALFCVF